MGHFVLFSLEKCTQILLHTCGLILGIYVFSKIANFKEGANDELEDDARHRSAFARSGRLR